MMQSKPPVYPYIPNSAPQTKQAMLKELGVESVEAFYADIPDNLRYKGKLDLPPALLSEAELTRHVAGLLNRNRSTDEYLSFLGAGCYQHQVPAVCDEINARSEFLTAYAGEPYEDHGRFQALFEYESMMGELLEMDVVNVPNYDGFQAAATALRMSARLTDRNQVILPGTIGKDKFSKILDYLQPDLEVSRLPYDPETGGMDLRSLRTHLTTDTAAVFFENPAYLGMLETAAAEIADLAHAAGALCVVSVEPLSLGVINPPALYGADIACGDIQSLGIHQNYGGGHGGFIATQDDPRLVMEFPSRLFGVAPTIVPGEYGFGDVAYERTSFALREEGKEWVGTAAALWGITAGVYLALMGPQGMREIGEGIIQRLQYLIRRLKALPGVRIPFERSPHFQEFVVDFNASNKTVAQINRALLEQGIFGGKDLSTEFPELGQSALYCVSEVHTQADLDKLVDGLWEVLR